MPSHLYNQRLLEFSAGIFKCFTEKKFFITLLIIVLVAVKSYSQTEQWLWANNAGGIFNEARGESIVTDAKYNVFVAGSFSCPSLVFGNFTVINNGGDDLFLVKYDSAGNILWAISAGDDYADQCHGVACDAAGNVFITGEFWSASLTLGDTTLINTGSDDVFIAKYDAMGNFKWARSASGSSEDVSNDIITDLSGNAYITGSFLSNSITMGSITLNNTNPGSEDMYIYKLDPNGNILWGLNPTGSDRDQGFGVATDRLGNLFVTGDFRSPTLSFGGVSIGNTGGDDMFIVKLDSSGNAIWAKRGKGNGYDYGFAIATDTSGNAYVAGQFGSSAIAFDIITITNSGSDDAYIVKFDPSGNALWAQDGGGNSYDYGYDIAVGADQSPTITGNGQSSSMNFGNFTLNNAFSGTDFFLVHYDTAGNVMWATNAGNTIGAYGYACAVDQANNAYISGVFADPSITLGSFTLSTSGGSDMYIAKYGSSIPTSTGNIISSSSVLSVYPNPTAGSFNINLAKNDNADLKIITEMGRVVMAKKISSNNQADHKIQLDPSLPEGIYMVEVIMDHNTYLSRIVYQK